MRSNTTDRSTLETFTKSIKDLTDEFVVGIERYVHHNFIAKMQIEALKEAKSNINMTK